MPANTARWGSPRTQFPPAVVLAFMRVALVGGVLGGLPEYSSDAAAWNDGTHVANAFNTWREMCYSPERSEFVAVAADQAKRTAVSSDGGRTFAVNNSANEAKSWISVCWAPQLGSYVALAQEGNVMTSLDGAAWTERRASDGATWFKVRFNGTRLVAIGVNKVMTSEDGITWTLRAASANHQWTALAWSPSLALWVALAGGGGSSDLFVMTSPDGIAWTEHDNNFGLLGVGTPTDLAWSPALGRFVCTNSGTITGGVSYHFYSDDALTWHYNVYPSPEPINSGQRILWSAGLRKFVALNPVSTGNYVATTPDGLAWTFLAAPGANVYALAASG